jgi:SNF2 family DNA or RNA helicase
MMAVHTSNVEPLPHQITAVYESMLPRQPLRYVLADDPGAGKTIMAGLLIRELLMRADAARILIVSPGSLVEQWQDELFEKFGLSFSLFSRDLMDQSRSGNPFDDHDLLVARLDQLSRSEELPREDGNSRWDLIVVDEAHKLSATWFGTKINETKRFKLGKLLGGHAPLPADDGHAAQRQGGGFPTLHVAARLGSLLRQVPRRRPQGRCVRHDAADGQGRPVEVRRHASIPERMAYTANYKLSEAEAQLYNDVTTYVKEEMNRADQLDGKRKGTVGFALTALQRRLASSPEAIYQSLEASPREAQTANRGGEDQAARGRQAIGRNLRGQGVRRHLGFCRRHDPEDYEEFEEEVVDQATAAQTIAELEAEVFTLGHLEEQAKTLVHSGQDRKWEELRELLQNTPEMRGPDGLQRKLIIFTEHRDTLNYLADRIRGLLGKHEAVVMIHGGVHREDRRKVQELFRNDKDTRVLLATDAAGEGVNLQNAHLMVNYDLPWNPNRLEQRFGRIHRIGQTQVCHLWNMVAAETREGDVFQKLFDKIEIERKALGGRVFDILGEVFDGVSLRDLLIEAIRYGEDPARKEHLREVVGRSAWRPRSCARSSSATPWPKRS